MLSKRVITLVVISEAALLLWVTGCEANRGVEMKRGAALDGESQQTETERGDEEVEKKAKSSLRERTNILAPELIGYRWVDDYPTFYLTLREVAAATSYVIEISTPALPNWRTMTVFTPSRLLPGHEATYSHRGFIRGVGIGTCYARVRARNAYEVGPASGVLRVPPPPVG